MGIAWGARRSLHHTAPGLKRRACPASPRRPCGHGVDVTLSRRARKAVYMVSGGLRRVCSLSRARRRTASAWRRRDGTLDATMSRSRGGQAVDAFRFGIGRRRAGGDRRPSAMPINSRTACDWAPDSPWLTFSTRARMSFRRLGTCGSRRAAPLSLTARCGHAVGAGEHEERGRQRFAQACRAGAMSSPAEVEVQQDHVRVGVASWFIRSQCEAGGWRDSMRVFDASRAGAIPQRDLVISGE